MQAIQYVLNIRISNNWGRYKHVTDSGILDELLDVSGFSGCRAEIHTNVKSRFAGNVGSYIERHSVPEIPGARDLLGTLLRQNAVSVAIATGGWRETAELKLRAVGIDATLIPIATASDSTDRCEILKIAVNRAYEDHHK